MFLKETKNNTSHCQFIAATALWISKYFHSERNSKNFKLTVETKISCSEAPIHRSVQWLFHAKLLRYNHKNVLEVIFSPQVLKLQ